MHEVTSYGVLDHKTKSWSALAEASTITRSLHSVVIGVEVGCNTIPEVETRNPYHLI